MSATAWVLVVASTVLFAAIGSFTCVVIDRLPVALDEPNEYGETWDTRPWREVFGGRSRCSDCGEDVRWVDNVPVVSWLALRGRCRSCGAGIPAFHPLVELATPALFLVALWRFGTDDWRLVVVAWLIPVGLAIAVIDARTLIVPTRIVWPAFFVTVALSAAVALGVGEPAWLLSAVVGLAVLAGPLFVVWFIFPRGMGFGDVRLTALLGWSVGFFAGVRPVAAAISSVSTLLAASMIGIVLGVVAFGARGRNAKVPFGPALIIAAYLMVVFAPEVLDPFDVFVLR